jgi:hypothetical protein
MGRAERVEGISLAVLAVLAAAPALGAGTQAGGAAQASLRLRSAVRQAAAAQGSILLASSSPTPPFTPEPFWAAPAPAPGAAVNASRAWVIVVIVLASLLVLAVSGFCLFKCREGARAEKEHARTLKERAERQGRVAAEAAEPLEVSDEDLRKIARTEALRSLRERGLIK